MSILKKLLGSTLNVPTTVPKRRSNNNVDITKTAKNIHRVYKSKDKKQAIKEILSEDFLPNQPQHPFEIDWSKEKSLTGSFVNNVIRDTVEKPAIGSVVWCHLSHFVEHTGIYVGRGQIIHLDGSGRIEKVNAKQFLERLDGLNLALSIMVSCKGSDSVGSRAVAERAKKMLGSTREYNVLFDNCHQFTVGCLTGDFENADNFFDCVERVTHQTLGSDTWRAWNLLK